VAEGGWRAIAASVPGTGHLRAGLGCQDAHLWQALPEGALVAAVADGAGSAPHGDVGARTAIATAVAFVAASSRPGPADEGGWRDLLREGLEAARSAVLAEAEGRGRAASDLASTLILTIATSDGVAAGQIGDGAAVVAGAEGALVLLTTPQTGEYANETTFLVSPDALATAQYALWRGMASHLALFSDGLQRLALRMGDATPHAPFFSALFRFARETTDETAAQGELTAFLSSPRVAERTDDDVTLLLATHAAR